VEEFIVHLKSLPPILVYLSVFAIAFIENLFPPFPSDVVVVFAGSLVGLGQADFLITLVTATSGSCLGFMAMYKVGHWFGHKILEQGKIAFIPLEAVRKVDAWFVRYGYGMIIANRFLAGTRAVVSFFAGMSGLSLLKTTSLSFLSALVWNGVLIGAGSALGSNWQTIGSHLATYSKIVTLIVSVVLLVIIVRFWFKSRKGGVV
jgi:membrane protein DedA with SNARE-associated domain